MRMNTNFDKSPVEQPVHTQEELQRMYPFGYFVFPDGEVYGRDPFQEASAGLDVDQDEIYDALQPTEAEWGVEEDLQQ